jgi:type I restriction enzyme R subunit
MALGSEQGAVQNPFVKYAQQAGWVYLSPDDARALRQGEDTSPVLDEVLIDQLQKLNPGVVDRAKAEELAARLVRVRTSIEGNFDAWEFLKGLKTVFVEAEGRERNVVFVDSERIDANTFHVTAEFTFTTGTPPAVRTDVQLHVNGIPVLVVETKSARLRDGDQQALGDIKYYHQHGGELFAVTQLYAVTHLIRFLYGGTWNTGRKALLNWRDEQAGDFETLCKTFVEPRRLVRLLAEFILFVRKDGELTKAVLRPHQVRAVERCLQRARDPQKKRGLVWHTQGSGKTYTMLTLARMLNADPAFANPTVLLIVDRNELEGQLAGELQSLGLTVGAGKDADVPLAMSKKDLEKLLRSDRRGSIVTMIHKFDDIPADVNLRKNVYVLVDEAHRTTGGDLGNFLMGALPNATYIGFTGTPIDRTAHGRGTFKVFGAEDATGYLDKYSIRDSIEDGATVPLHYALAPSDMQVDRDTLEKEFLDLREAEGVSDQEELNAVLERAVTLKALMKSPARVDKVAQYIAGHYRDKIEPMGYKAFVVAVDREACVLYKEALDRHLPPEWSRVVISKGGKKDSDALRRHYLEEDEERNVRKGFRRPIGLPETGRPGEDRFKELRILIVTEKLLTGYDAPILYCMYLDKPMRDHVLLQAIARVNRPYEDDTGRRKPDGFVMDFVGIFGNLKKALAFDSQDVEAVVEGIDVLQDHFRDLMGEGRRKYLPVSAGKVADKAVEAVLEHFRDREIRQQFYVYFQELSEVYEVLSPDAILRPFLADYTSLTEMYQVLRANYERGTLPDKDFLRKTAALVQKHAVAGDVQAPAKVHRLTAETLAQIAGNEEPDAVKVFNLLRAVRDVVQQDGKQEPYLLNIGTKAEEVILAYEDRQKTTWDALADMLKIVEQLRKARQEREDSDLPPEAFAVSLFLKGEGVAKAEEVARQVAAAFAGFPHWQTSDHQEQGLRRALYKALLDGGVSTVVDYAQRIMMMLRRAQP